VHEAQSIRPAGCAWSAAPARPDTPWNARSAAPHWWWRTGTSTPGTGAQR